MITVTQAEVVDLRTIDDAMMELWHHQNSFEAGYWAGRFQAIEENNWAWDKYQTKKPMGLRPDPWGLKPPRTKEFYKMRRLGKIYRRRAKYG